jgi:hypothetical protein
MAAHTKFRLDRPIFTGMLWRNTHNERNEHGKNV